MTRDERRTTREECSPEAGGNWEEVALLECKWPQKDLGKKGNREGKTILPPLTRRRKKQLLFFSLLLTAKGKHVLTARIALMECYFFLRILQVKLKLRKLLFMRLVARK